MTSLATVAQLRSRKGERRLAHVFPELDSAEIEIKVAEALASASDEAVGYLTNRYADRISSLTAETCPGPLRDRVIVMAWWLLHRDAADVQAEAAHRDYKDALHYLGLLSSGAATLLFEERTAVDRTEPAVLSAESNTGILDYFEGR